MINKEHRKFLHTAFKNTLNTLAYRTPSTYNRMTHSTDQPILLAPRIPKQVKTTLPDPQMGPWPPAAETAAVAAGQSRE
jgi:hypothetical protein